MMKRRMLTILVFLLLGAIVNVAVAWRLLFLACTRRKSCILAVRLLAIAAVVFAAMSKASADSLFFDLPAPINDEDVGYITRWLRLSEAQQVAFSAMLARYQESHKALFDDRIAKIQRLADEGAAMLASGFSPE